MILRHMDDVLQTILRLGFKLRLSKCKFAQRQNNKTVGKDRGEWNTTTRSKESLSGAGNPTSDIEERNSTIHWYPVIPTTGFSFRICQSYRIVSLNSRKWKKNKDLKLIMMNN